MANNFFKDQKFILIYLYDELLFRTDDVSSMVVNDEGKSVVISARGGVQTDGIHVLDNGKFFEKQKEKDKKWFDVYLTFKHVSDEESQILKESPDIDFINHLISMGDSKFVRELMILACSDDGEFNVEDDPSIIKAKVGGPEIVAEYMLSRFIGNYKKFYSDEIAEKVFDLRIEANRSEDGFSKYDFDFDLDGDLSQLEKIDDSGTDIDLDGTVWDGSFERFQFNIDEKSVNELNEKFIIPSRIYDVLTKEQLLLLKKQAPSILIEEMDFIGSNIFNQKFDSFEAHNRLMESRAYSRNWSKSMSDILGDDGSYLGDGMTLTKDGLIDD